MATSEVRHVLFDKDEVAMAIRNYCGKSGHHLPAHAVFTVDGGANPYVLVSSGRAKGAVASFSGEALIAPLILHCSKKRIPLPIVGIKGVAMVDDQLALLIKMR